MASTIKIKNNGTAGVAPTAGQLVAGELALNRADGQLYYLTAANSVAAITDTIDGGTVATTAGILLNFNGSNNGTTFTHSGSSSPAITRVGSVVTGTAQKKYGTASGYFPGANNCLDIASDSTFNFGSSDFCIEMWIYPIALDGNTTLLRVGSDAAGQQGILFGHSTGMGCYVSSNGSSWGLVNGSSLSGLTTNAWHHVALTRSGNTFRGFVNGSVAFTVTASGAVYSNNTTARVGAANTGGQYAFNGYIDDFRVTRGEAVYTAAFTPSTTELTSSLSGGSRSSTIKVRGSTAATLASVNPTPAVREPVYETDTRCLKISGDGTTAYNSLGYVRPYVTATDRLLGRSSAGAGAAEEITCTADARANVLANSNVFAARAFVNFNGTAAASALQGTYTQSATTITITTSTSHGLTAGQIVTLDFTSGLGVDNTVTISSVTSATVFVVPAGQSQTTSGNVSIVRNSIRSAGNVSSVADVGVGKYFCNFQSPMSDTNYAVVATSGGTANASLIRVMDDEIARTTNYVEILCQTIASGNANIDPAQVSVVVFR